MIAILLSLCSKNQGWKNTGDIDLFNTFLQGFYNTICAKMNTQYIFFIGYDSNDDFIKNHIDIIKKRIHMNDVLIELPAEKTNGNPCEAWNILAREAYKNKDIEYFYQVGTDIMHITPNWDKYFIKILSDNNNIGICGGVHKQYYLERTLRNDRGIIENAFLHRTHINKFNGIFKDGLKNWFSDDWITNYYRKKDCCYICPFVEFLNTNRVLLSNQGDNTKNRYDPDVGAKYLVA